MVGKEYGVVQKLYAMSAQITMSTMLIFCLIVVEKLASWLHSLINLVLVVACACIFYFNIGFKF